MNFCSVGDAVIHPKLGTGRVVKLLGAEGDDGVKIKLDSGRSVDVKYWDDAATKGWRRVKPATQDKMRRRSAGVVEKLIGKMTEAAGPSKLVVAKLDDLEIADELSDFIAELEGDDPFLLSINELQAAAKSRSGSVTRSVAQAAFLAQSLAQQGFTHIYTA